jgi:hypothetical protein
MGSGEIIEIRSSGRPKVHRKYLGDSYDAVKRMWQQIFEAWAPLYAEPRFISEGLRKDFTHMTNIPIMTAGQQGGFTLFNDPDTGIRLPGQSNQQEGRSHITIDTILLQLRIKGTRCVITFDQSHYRLPDMPREEQRRVKMRELSDGNSFSFYYVSHAPFLFAFPTASLLKKTRTMLVKSGIPNERFQN